MNRWDGEHFRCLWCNGVQGRQATYCSARCRVAANRVLAAYRRGELRACVWVSPAFRLPRIVRVDGDGIRSWAGKLRYRARAIA